jgi:bacteriocin-like protein
MKTVFNQPMEFEVLSENEMELVKGGTAKEKDVFDPDEH